MSINGGPAFPRALSGEVDPVTGHTTRRCPAQQGMSLRDYFAAAALQGLAANPGYDEVSWDEVAALADDAADAMIERRKKNKRKKK